MNTDTLIFKVTFKNDSNVEFPLTGLEIIPVDDDFLYRLEIPKGYNLTDLINNKYNILRLDIFYKNCIKFSKFVEGNKQILVGVNHKTDTDICEIQFVNI